MLIVFNG